MRKIILYICFFLITGCIGYEPLFSSKSLSYYIIDIEKITKNSETDKISKRLKNNKSKKKTEKKAYVLKISSNTKNTIASKDSKGNVTAYKLIIDVDLEVYNENSELAIKLFKFNKNTIYNNQEIKSDLNRYKKNLLENLIDKIVQDITIKLQSL